MSEEFKCKGILIGGLVEGWNFPKGVKINDQLIDISKLRDVAIISKWYYEKRGYGMLDFWMKQDE